MKPILSPFRRAASSLPRRAFILLFFLSPALASAAVEPSAVFSDHAVLLRSPSTAVFGFAGPGEKVSVSVAGAEDSAVAGADGRWIVRLDLSAAAAGPHEMRIGDRVFRDVVVGEVWLASGQSNMSFKMASADDADTECRLENPGIRCFVESGWVSASPKLRAAGRWVCAGPKTTKGMTAVGYHFAKNLNSALGVPVGVVESAVGAASIEAWCEPESMSADAAGRAALDRQIAFMAGYRDYERSCDAALAAWRAKFGREDRPHGPPPAAGWAELSEDDAAHFSRSPGAVWLRRKVPAAGGGRRAEIFRRRFIEREWLFDTSDVEVYWNGRRLERLFPENPADKNTEYFRPEPGMVLAENTLEIRFFNAERVPCVPWSMFYCGARLPYSGWSVCEEFSLPALKGSERAALPARQKFCLQQHWPTGIYNGKIAGLVPMSLSGVIWYQGETNASRAEEYEVLFPAFIKSWRNLFCNRNLPFAWCQLAGFRAKEGNADAKNMDWPRLRSAQDRALSLPATGQAVLIDAGEAGDIHPRDKRTPGARLAAWALNTVYGRKDVPYLGPRVAKVEPKGGRMVVTFKDCAGGLVVRELGERYVVSSKKGLEKDLVRNSPQAQVEGFSLCGADGKWYWADTATISGNTVVVSSKNVPEPVNVRYAYATNPIANLYNTDGFPAVPYGE